MIGELPEGSRRLEKGPRPHFQREPSEQRSFTSARVHKEPAPNVQCGLLIHPTSFTKRIGSENTLGPNTERSAQPRGLRGFETLLIHAIRDCVRQPAPHGISEDKLGCGAADLLRFGDSKQIFDHTVVQIGEPNFRRKCH